jgi:hypothetical protein
MIVRKCSECAHYNEGLVDAFCKHPNNIEGHSVIDGHRIYKIKDIEIVRDGNCRGEWYEPDLFTRIKMFFGLTK